MTDDDTMAPDSPLRLEVAARLAFPDGSMTAGGLRRLGRSGKLALELMNGRFYTTLDAIRQMREQCRLAPKVRASGSGPQGVAPTARSLTPRLTSSSIADDKLGLDALLTPPPAQSNPSRATLRKSTV